MEVYYAEEITTVLQLMQEVQDVVTGGYECDVTVQPNTEQALTAGGFFLIIDVDCHEPGRGISGEWWFDADGHVMQVL